MARFSTLRIVTLCTILLATIGVVGKSISRTSWPLKEQKPKEARAPQEIELIPNDDRYPEIGHPALAELPTGSVLLTIDDTLYLLNTKKEVAWQNEIIDMVDSPIVDSHGQIYGIAGDVRQFVVNEATGEVTYFGPQYGGTHSYYTQIEPYGDGEHLVIENMEHYRQNNACFPKCPDAPDRIESWRGETCLWSTKFPANAELRVWGNRILALSKEKDRVVLQEIEAPSANENHR